MKTKKLLTKIFCAVLVVVMIATCAPVMSFAAEGDLPECKPVSLSNVTGGVKVAYKENKEAISYTLYRRTDNTDWEAITTIKPKSYFYLTDKTAESGNTYYYSVEVTTAAGSSGHDEVGQKILYLASPVYTLENAGSTVKITINSVNGADSYQILRKVAGSSETLTCVATADANSEDVVIGYDTTAQSGVTYTYAVRAKSGNVLSYHISTNFTTLLASPVSLSNVDPGVKVTYKKVEGATSYTLYRKTADSDWVVLNTIKPRSYYYFIDKTAVSGTEYFYCVGYTTADNEVTADPFGKKIEYLETATVFLSNNEDSVTIDFTAVPGATSYKIMRKLPSQSSYKAIGTVSGDTFTFVDKNVEIGDTYVYAVRAYDNGYYSYLNGETIEVAVFTADDEVIVDDIDLFDDITLDDEVIADLVDETIEDAVDDEEIADVVTEGFDFVQILDFISNFINGLDVGDNEILATIISVLNTILEYVYSALALVA